MSDLSEIQLQILTNLLKANGLRYSQARPKKIENDLYNYHLQFLLKKKFIEKKEDNKYYLSRKGKKYVLKMDVLGEVKEYFKFSVLVYTIRVNRGKKQILLQKRLRHPYFGDIGTVAGKVLRGEKIEDAAKRKLEEETGLKAKCKFLGVIRKIRRNKEKVVDDTLFHVCYAENPRGKLVRKNSFGENLWDSFEKAIKYQRKNITTGKETEKILNRIRRRDLSLFYHVEDITLNFY